MKPVFALRVWAVLAVGLACLGAALAGDDTDDPFSPANQVKRVTAHASPVDDLADPFAPANQVKWSPPPAVTPEKTAAPVVRRLSKLSESGKNLLVEVSVAPATINRGDVLTLTIKGTPQNGYHTYPITLKAPKQIANSTLTFDALKGVAVLGGVEEIGKPEFADTGDPEEPLRLEFDTPFTWTQKLVVLPDAPTGPLKVPFSLDMQVCDKHTCTPRTDRYEIDLTVSNSPPTPLSAAIETQLKEPPPPIRIMTRDGKTYTQRPENPPEQRTPRDELPKTTATNTVPLPDEAAAYRGDLQGILDHLEKQPVSSSSTGLLAFMLAGVFWGGVSLITPCVFPMIPITVSFFLKQAEKEHGKPVQMALIYSGTIITVLTIAAVALLSVFRWLSLNPIMNFALGGLFVYFALSLFGMYEIELPSALSRFTSTREQQGGVIGTIFMALTFTIVSFACVAPFLGGFGGTAAASGDITLLHRFLGGFAFATTFAAPFFVLALFPNLLKKLPKSGSWLNSVKVVMGFLELAAALKFMRSGEISLSAEPAVFTYDLVLGLWIALSVLCGCYLLSFYRLPHDSPSESIVVPRLLLGALFLGFAFYLLPALFRVGPGGEVQRPRGSLYAWVDSFLLPEEDANDLPWTGNLKAALAEARTDVEAGKPGLVFIDFTGEQCTNCRWNEKNVFRKPQVRSLLEQYHLVQLYNDTRVPSKFYSAKTRGTLAKSNRQHEDAVANLDFQDRGFGTIQSPLYAILQPRVDGSTIVVLGQYTEGKINDQSGFVQFLQQPLERVEKK